ncbi:MAG: nuclear transport factor 2 family protein [Gemmatimonadaceae bacterium]
MTDRAEMENLLRRLHGARVAGDLAGILATFSDNVSFRIAGASDGKPISIAANGVMQVRSWLSVMVKSFWLTDYAQISTIVEGSKAAALWQVTTHSRITGLGVPTELVDLIEVHDGKITSYTEFFTPVSAGVRKAPHA